VRYLPSFYETNDESKIIAGAAIMREAFFIYIIKKILLTATNSALFGFRQLSATLNLSSQMSNDVY
jgi:hypothetical protein